ncbi:hypothetical protein SESBI_42487 [Sesbania bispinosa]|nr:hypothetical protein SESBI_42487 [Sesbania bispinosa]
MASQNPNHRNSLYPSIDVSDLAEDLVPNNTSPSTPPTVSDEIQWSLAKDEATIKVDSKASKRMNDTTAFGGESSAAMSLLPGSPSSPNVPALHLPGSNLQSSRLRSSLSARDIPPEDLNVLSDFDVGRSCRSKTLSPSNLEELFSAELLKFLQKMQDMQQLQIGPTLATISKMHQASGVVLAISVNFLVMRAPRRSVESVFKVFETYATEKLGFHTFF